MRKIRRKYFAVKNFTKAFESCQQNDELLFLNLYFQKSILVFPEGKRFVSDEIQPFKKGSFEIAIKSGVRVQPVIIQKYRFIDHEKQQFGRGVVRVKILPPLDFVENETVHEYAERAHRVMNEEFQKMNETPK